jgi:hypothetical protein
VNYEEARLAHEARMGAFTRAIEKSRRLDACRRLAYVAFGAGELWWVRDHHLTGMLALGLAGCFSLWAGLLSIAQGRWCDLEMKRIDRDFPKPRIDS